MKAKNIVLALVATGLISTHAYAAEERIEGAGKMAPQATFSDADLQTMFESSASPMQVAALSQREMQDTAGAAIWFAPAAWAGVRYAITGFTRHGLNQVISRNGVGVSNQAILSVMRNPTRIYSQLSNRAIRYEGPGGVVVTNQAGRVITAWGTPR